MYRVTKDVQLSSKAVEGPALPLERVHHVHGGDCLPLCVLSVGDRVPDDILEEDLEHTAGLFIDQPRDSLDSSTPGETADGGLGDALDVVAKDLPVPLGAALSKTLSSFAATGHCGVIEVGKFWTKMCSFGIEDENCFDFAPSRLLIKQLHKFHISQLIKFFICLRKTNFLKDESM